jgi:hypothetical protein
MPAMSDFFNEAYQLARSRFSSEQWLALPPQQVTQAIYEAMRELDAAAAAQAGLQPRGKPAPKNTANAPC